MGGVTDSNHQGSLEAQQIKHTITALIPTRPTRVLLEERLQELQLKVEEEVSPAAILQMFQSTEVFYSFKKFSLVFLQLVTPGET